MRLAENWKEYELLDATDGNRLERWGKTVLIRPDPQVVWHFEQASPLWQRPDAIYHRSAKGGGSWEKRGHFADQWTISYGDLRLKVSPTGFKHTGIFPEQAVNWDAYRRLIEAAGRPVKCSTCLAIPAGQPSPARRRGSECLPSGRLQGNGRLGAGKTPPSAASPTGRFAGLWTIVPSLSSGRHAAAAITMRLSWIRRVTAEGRRARCGSWRTVSLACWRTAPRF